MAVCKRCKFPIIKGFGWCTHCGNRIEEHGNNNLYIKCTKCQSVMQRVTDRLLRCRKCNKSYVVCRNCKNIAETQEIHQSVRCLKCGILT